MKFRLFLLLFATSSSLLVGNSKEEGKSSISRTLGFKNIMISLSPYNSFNQALDDEQGINWHREVDKAEAITDAFAASELQMHFRLLGSKLKVLKYRPKSIGSTIVIIDRKQLEKNHPSLAQRIPFNELGDQGFSIMAQKKTLFIIANSRIGRLYGVYEFLNKLGFSWYNPKEIIVPKYFLKNLKLYETHSSPKVKLRGFWTVSEEYLPDEYALWLARNKFNLTGKTKPYLAKKLGLKIWGGGHKIIQEEFSKKEVFDEHPEWFILNKNKRHPVKMKGNYINPSFANKEGAEYFSKQLIKRLSEGDLQNIDILNIWPADKKRFFQDQSEAAKSMGNFSDALLYFYSIIADNLERAYENKILSRKVILAGISYHQTLAPPSNKKIIKALASKNYVHLFYPSTRDWTYALNNNLSPTNLKLSEAIDSWKKTANFSYGFVDYNHKSNYYGIAITNHINIASDFEYYFPKKDALYAYMHPVKDNPGPFELTNELISKMTWQQSSKQREELQEKIIIRYFQSKYGRWAEEWQHIYDAMMKAVSNSKHIFETGSLSSVLFQKIYWKRPPFKKGQVIELIEKYKKGGLQHVLDGYTNKKDEYGSSEFIGLNESLEMQRGLKEKWLSISRRVKDPAIRKRIMNDIDWFETSLRRYTLISLCADYVIAENLDQDSDVIKAAILDQIDSLYNSKPIKDVFSNDHVGAFLRTSTKLVQED